MKMRLHHIQRGNKMKRKVQSKKGFTLVEMVACILTLTIISGICTSGINLAIKCYQESVFESESQMLKSTIDLSINDILRYATNVETEEVDGEQIVKSFTNVGYQVVGGSLAISPGTNKFVLYNLPEGTAGRKEYILIGNQAYGKDMYIAGFKLTYEESTGCFFGEYTIKSTMVQRVEKTFKFACRTITK